jgi:hypothetical protein
MNRDFGMRKSECGMRKLECGLGNGKCGVQNGEIGIEMKSEVGKWNLEVGICGQSKLKIDLKQQIR